MDSELIRRWNNTVGEGDTVYHVGDFAFRNWAHYLPLLNGEVKFVKGNHDHKKYWEFGKGSPEVPEYRYEEIEGKRILFYHWPIWRNSGDTLGRLHNPPPLVKRLYKECDYLIYGHSHNSPEWGRPEKAKRACVEDWNYTPVPLATLLALAPPSASNAQERVI